VDATLVDSMRSTQHILVVNGTKVRRPVFILGAPHSGTDLLARAIRHSSGFHLTIGRPEVLRVVYAFARRPSMLAGQGRGAARVLRDALAESWRVSPGSCAECSADCQALGGYQPPGPCLQPGAAHRFADASPDLLYSTDALLDAFPDAQLLQVIRDGRDVVADMLDDERCLAWLRPGFDNLDRVFPNPFLGVADHTERNRWPMAAMAVKCALRWRGSIRLSAQLRAQTPAEQLHTVRYEDLATRPGAVVDEVSEYLGAPISRSTLSGLIPAADRAARPPTGRWRERLSARQITQVEKIAGTELRRLGYRLSDQRPSR
jgi:hypothetical protein